MGIKPIDFGARMCELLFVASGFLVGYNYYKTPMDADFKTSVKYLWKKIRVIWPLHIIVLLLVINRNYESLAGHFDATMGGTLAANAFLLQAWSNKSAVYFSFNGVTWFLSAILFCYALSPFLLLSIRKKRYAAVAFVLFATIRIVLDIWAKNGAKVFPLDFHVNPVIRCLEFGMGMTVVPFVFLIKEKLDAHQHKVWFKSTFTIVEIGLPILTYFLMLWYEGVWTRGTFALLFVAVIFLSAFDYGYIACLCHFSAVQKVFACELEMFIPQTILNYHIKRFFALVNWTFPTNVFATFLIKILIIFVIALLYKKCFEGFLANGMDRLARLGRRLINIPDRFKKAS